MGRPFSRVDVSSVESIAIGIETCCGPVNMKLERRAQEWLVRCVARPPPHVNLLVKHLLAQMKHARELEFVS